MLEGALGDELGDHVHVVRRAHLVELRDPLRPRRRVAEADAREPKLRHGPHHHQVRKLAQPVHERAPGEHVVRLVDHHETRRRLDDARDLLFGKEVSGRVVRIGDEDQRRARIAHRRKEALEVEREIGCQGNTGVAHADEGRVQAVHDERGLGREQRRPGARQRLRDDLDDLVRPVADQEPAFARDLEDLAQARLQFGRGGIGIPVDRQRRDEPCDLLAQRFGQPIRILHRVELDHSGRGRHRIRFQREDLFADEFPGSLAHGVRARLIRRGSAPSARGRADLRRRRGAPRGARGCVRPRPTR